MRQMIGLIVVTVSWMSTRADFHPLRLWELLVAATLVRTLMNRWFLRRELNRKLGPAAAVDATAAAG